MRVVLLLIFIVLAALGGLSLWFTQSTPELMVSLSSSNSSSDSSTFNTDDSLSNDREKVITYQENQDESTPALRHEQEILMSLPRSLRGTDVNGGFEVDSNGHLILSKSNKDFFEYFLSTLGEENLEQVMDRMISLIELKLPSPAKEETIQLLHNYVDLKRALVNLEQEVGEGLAQYGDSPLAQHKARLEMLSGLRNQYLGNEAATAFFGESEDFDRYMLDKMAVTSNATLSDQERSQALVSLMENAPESIKPRLEDEYKMQKLNLDVENLRASGADSEAIYQARSQVLGEDAAQRLAQVDQAQAEWTNKYQDYQTQKAQIDSEGLSEEAYQTQVEALQTRLFEENEIRRVQALDRIKGS